MLGEQGIIQEGGCRRYRTGLKDILADIEAGKVEFALDAEDIHMNGNPAHRAHPVRRASLHTGRSRNDQVALDCRMYVKDAAKEAIEKLKSLMSALLDTAQQHTLTIMPG